MPGRLAALRRTLDVMPPPVPDRGGAVLCYEQWNIDPESVVSFAALAFGQGTATPGGEGGA